MICDGNKDCDEGEDESIGKCGSEKSKLFHVWVFRELIMVVV